MKLPKLKINKEGRITDINGRKIKFRVGKYVTLRQSTYPEKIFVLEEIKFENGKEELRLGYYIIGKRGRKKGKWTWGQFCPFIPKKDLIRLIRKAKEKGILKT